ncbi:MAG: hypothetical protein ABSD90_18135 [Methylocystis sp.]|jgi:hypothetical protein
MSRIGKTTDHELAPAEASTPAAAPPAKKPRKTLKPLTLEERLAFGSFQIPEAAQLCACSVSSVNPTSPTGGVRGR